MNSLGAVTAYAMPTSAQLAQEELTDHSTARDRVLAAAEVVRAAVILQAADVVTASMSRLLEEYAGWTPPVAEVRVPAIQMATEENSFKRQLANELRISDDSLFRQTFQKYRRRLDRLSETSESARLTLLLLSSRIIHSGGAASIQQTMAASPLFRQEVLLDELSGLLSVAAMQSKADLPEVINPDVSLRRGSASVGLSQQLVPVVLVTADVWANRSTRFGECVKALESGAGKELAGLRSALLSELVLTTAMEASEPEAILNASLAIQNGIWREEALQIAGRSFAQRSLEKACEAWLGKTKVPSMEQISLLYGINLGILDRPRNDTQGTPAAANGSANKGMEKL